jgi:exopolysaccharide production protein ExoQ
MNFMNKSMIHLIYPIIAISIGLSSVLSLRDVTRAATDLSTVWAGSTSAISEHILQFSTFCVLAICLARICNFLVAKVKLRSEVLPLLKAFLGFFVATVLLNGVLGSRPSFNYHSIYCLIIIVAVFLDSNHVVDISIKAAKSGLLILLFASGVAAIFLPTIAVQQSYNGLLPFADIRLWGLASHPNSLGSLSLLLLLLLIYQPFDRRWKQYSAISVAFGIFLLAQSKTAFFSAIVAFAIIKFYNVLSRFGIREAGLIVSLLAFTISGIIIGSMVLDAGGQLAQLVSSKAGAETLTLTGRSQIWDIAINEWQQNPLFGYGPSLWDVEFRDKIDMDFAFSAHNQFLQCLSGAGLVGLLSLITYLSVLFRFAARSARRTEGFTLALFSVVIIRCITETPLELGTFLNGDFFMHLILFQMLACFGTNTTSK